MAAAGAVMRGTPTQRVTASLGWLQPASRDQARKRGDQGATQPD